MKDIIFDGKYYYLFRALSKEDIEDLDENNIDQMRTNCIRKYEKNGVWGKYNDRGVSLEEVYDHIKIRHRYDTNCISLTKNSNVALTYQKNNGGYAIIQIEPQELEEYFEAGEYFKKIISEKIENVTKELTPNSQMIKILQSIDNVTTKKQFEDILKGIKDLDSLIQIDLRKEKKYLSEKEQLEIDKLLAKLSLLEQKGLIGNIIKDVPNSNLIRTMSNAYSSSEYIHYGNIPKEKVFLCSKIFLDIFSLLQQKQGENIQDLTNQILQLIREGYKIEIQGEKAWLLNEKNKIELNKNEIKFALKNHFFKKELQKDLTISKAYELTGGKISYRDTNMQLTAIRLLVEMKLKQKILVKMLENIFPEIDVENLLKDTYCINPELVIRQNGRGQTISQTVNILISEFGFDLSKEDIEKILNRINELKVEELLDIYQNGINSESIKKLLIKTRNLNERIESGRKVDRNVKYFGEAIVEGYDWKKIGRGLKIKEKEKLSNKILMYATGKNEILDLYEALKKIWIQNKPLKQEEIFAVIINMAINKKIGNVSYKTLIESSNKSEILINNIRNLQTTVEPIELDVLMRRGKRIKALKQQLIDLGMDEEFVNKKDIRNLYMAQKIVDGYNFGKILTSEEKVAIMKCILDNRRLDKDISDYLLALKNSLERSGLTEQGAYGAIINMSINGSITSESGYNYSRLISSSVKVNELNISKKNISTEVSEVTIQKALSKSINQHEESKLKQRLIELGISEEFIQERETRNLYNAEKIVEGYYFGRDLKSEEKRALIYSILKNRQLNNRALFNVIENFKKIGLKQQQIYGIIINSAVNCKVIDEFGYDYSILLHTPSKILELSEKLNELNCEVKLLTIQRAMLDNLDEEEIKKVEKQLISLGIDKEFIKQKDSKNIWVAKKIVDQYCFEEELKKEEKRAILESILESYLLDEKSSGYLINLISNLEEIGLTEQEIYGTIIKLAINKIIISQPDYSYDALLSSSKQVKKLAEYKDEIDSRVGPVTIRVAVINRMNQRKIEKEKQELIDLGIDEDFIEQKDPKNICMAKRIVEEYCFDKTLSPKEKRAIIHQMLKGLALNKKTGSYITTLASNLEKIGLNKQEVYGTIINLGINGTVIEQDGYFYTVLLGSAIKTMELAKYKEKIDSKVSPITIQRARSNNIDNEEEERLRQELIELGLDKEFVDQKDIKNIYMALKIVENYKFEREFTVKEKSAIIKKILREKRLNKDGTTYLTALTNNFRKIGLSEQEIYGAIINLAIDENAIEEKGYGYPKLIPSPLKIINLRGQKEKINCKVELGAVEKAVINNLNQQETESLKKELMDLGIDEDFIEQKDIKNIYMAQKILKEYLFERELEVEEKKAILLALLGVKILNKDVGISLITLKNNLENIGLTKQEVYGVIINLAINCSVTKEAGYDYSKLLGRPTKVLELINYDIETKVSEETIRNAQEKAERIMRRAIKNLKKQGKISEIADTNRKLEDLVKKQKEQIH